MKRLATMMLILTAVLVIFTGCSKSESKEEDTLVIGIDDKFAPMGFRDEDNNIVGFDIDYAKAAA
jgi:polar amino acid transport system substrate-binding protein